MVGNKFNTSDQAFEITAKLLVDYLSLKLPPGVSSYHIDVGDMAFLDAVVPHDIRPGFVKAVEYRSACLPESGHLTPIQQLVKECVRLGLGREDCFLLGGGMKMDDGRILVLPNGSNIVKAKETKQKKVQQVTQVNTQDLTWLMNSGLPADQVELIKSAMSDINISEVSTLADNDSAQQHQQQQKQEKIEMHTDRRKRTSNSRGRALLQNGFGDGLRNEVKPITSNRPMTASTSASPGDTSKTMQTNQALNSPIKINNNNRSVTPNKIRQPAPKILKTKPPTNNYPAKEKNARGERYRKEVIGQGFDKEVIGGPPPMAKGDSAKAERALQRRMRSMERMSKMRMYEEEVEAPLQTKWRDSLWDYSAHGGAHKFLVLSIVAPLCKFHISDIFRLCNQY